MYQICLIWCQSGRLEILPKSDIHDQQASVTWLILLPPMTFLSRPTSFFVFVRRNCNYVAIHTKWTDYPYKMCNIKALCKWRYQSFLRMTSIFDTKVNSVLRIVFFISKHSITSTLLSPKICTAPWDYSKNGLNFSRKNLCLTPFIGSDKSCTSIYIDH